MSIIVTDLHYKYNKGLPTEVSALNGVSLNVEPGEIISVVGHMGSGKSTLAQHLNGLIFAQSGTVVVDGCKVTDKAANLNAIRRKVGFVFQYPEHQIFAETVEKEISFGPSNWGLSGASLSKRVREAITLIGLDEDILNKNPFTLSGGLKRRVAIASVIASAPDYIVMDEPNAGLDSSGTSELIDLMKSRAQDGVGVIHITHDLELALTISTKILVLNNGISVSWGTPQETVMSLCSDSIDKLPLPDILNLSNMLKKSGKIDDVTLDAYRLASMISEKC